MATYYVRTTGSDAAAGTSAATAWLTIAKAMGTAGAADGDTVYVGAGTYRESAITVATHASMTYLYGDTDGSKTGDSGEIVVSNFTTSDTSTTNTNVNVFNFASKSYWTVARITIVCGGNAYAVNMTGTTANLTFQDVTVHSGGYGFVLISNTFGTVHNLTIERCRLFCLGGALYLAAPTSATGAEVNMNIVIRNCVAMSAYYVCQVAGGASNTFKSGGITFTNCLLIGGDSTIGCVITSQNPSTTYTPAVYNSLVVGWKGFATGVANTLVENYNVILSNTPRTGVTAGANSVSGGATTMGRNWRFSLGHEASWGGVIRSFGDLPLASNLLTWGGTAVATDDINGVTRPASGASQAGTAQALGPFERPNSATRETTTTRTGGTAIKIAGPGYHDFELAVSPVSTSVSVWSYKDNTYGTAATGPQLIIANAGEAGYAGTTITSAGGTGVWAAMTATFTPTSAGIVTVRLQSNANVGTANVYFDDFAVA